MRGALGNGPWDLRSPSGGLPSSQRGWLGGVGWQEVVRGGGLVLSLKVFNWMKAQRCYRAQTAVYNDLCHLAARHRSVTRARHLFYEMLEWR